LPPKSPEIEVRAIVTSRALRIVVADDHDAMRSAICDVIDEEVDMEVVGRATNVSEALRLVSELTPDVVVTDVWMPGGGGSGVCEGVRSLELTAAVVAVSASSFASTESSMLAAGATAFLLKDAVTSQLPSVIRRACSLSSEHSAPLPETKASTHAIIVTDRFGTICGWDDGAESLYGWSASEVLGRPIFDMPVGPNEVAAAAEIMGRLSSGETWKGEFTVSRKDGSTFLAYVVTTPIVIDHVVQCLVGVSKPVEDSRF
jgi:PAS domain S-box-containing protein